MDPWRSLEDDVTKAFSRACRERDWEVAEYLFQALEAISKRDGDDDRLERAFGELVEHLGETSRHRKRREQDAKEHA